MGFWGVEVKPGIPVTHSYNGVRKRLRITQATLAIGAAAERILVQCNIGNKSPAFICALVPEMTESCGLDLEFEEEEDVIFSVLGPRGVYLTGYYVGNYRPSAQHSDTESFGEDIASTETEGSGRDRDRDEYDDSFIDDGELVVSSPSHVSSNGVIEEMVNETKEERKGNKRLQRKMSLSSSSNEQTASLESEDEEKFPLSVLMRKKAAKQVKEKTNESRINVIKAGKAIEDQPAKTSEAKKTNANEDTDFDLLADGSQMEEPKRKKKEKKIKKNKEKINEFLLSAYESEKPSKPCLLRSLSNGLVIEELAMGDQDGKIAAFGRKVKVFYTGMLKESGHVIDSNIGKAPYKFRLGDEEVIEGWNVGIEGMRVGDKRRLTIPPLMGYGDQGDGENVPPNSWLVFDIELVRVR